MTISELFSVNTTFLTLWSYQMSYLEFFGTIFTAWSVFLAAKNKIQTWPIGILGIILFGILFFQIRLYSDLFEQFYYFVTSFWGWWVWSRMTDRKSVSGGEVRVSRSSDRFNALGLVSIFFLTLILWFSMSRIHIWWPSLFPEAASFPLLDAFTTALSFVANIYLAKRRIENWYLWILVDVIGVYLYFQKEVIFLSLLYLVFLINAVYGLRVWSKSVNKQ